MARGEDVLNNRKKLVKILFSCGLLLLVIAIGMLGLNISESTRSEREAKKIDAALEDMHKSFFKQVEGDVIPEMEVLEIDGKSYIGILEIPALDIKASVSAESDEKKLKVASGSYYTDDLVICGLSFESLQGIEKDADVYLTTADAKIIQYKVTGKDKGDFDLAISAGTAGEEDSFTVRCKRIE